MSLDDVATQAEFVKQQSLAFPLLSDADASVAGRYGVLFEDKPYAKRVTVIVDPQGVVRSVDGKVAVDTHGTDLAARIRELRESR